MLECSERLSWKVVVAACLHRGQPLAEAGKRECVVAYGADVMLGLPDTPTLGARARVERVDDAPPEDVVRDRRRGNEEVPLDRWIRNLGLVGSRLAEQKPKSWPGGTKPSRRRHGEIELKRVRQQEYAVDGRTALEVGKLHCVTLADERPRPVVEHLSGRNVVGDAEGEIQV